MTPREIKIYDLLFVSRTTLKDLIDNIYLDNYKHVEIYKKDSRICVDLTFQIDDSAEGTVVRTYEFDSELGYVMKVKQVGKKPFLTYDRDKECKEFIGSSWHEAREAIIEKCQFSWARELQDDFDGMIRQRSRR